MSVIDDLLRNNDAYAAAFEQGGLPRRPAKKLTVLTCMDARLDTYAMLGLHEGDAHVLRNAGAVVTGDQIRSLAVSQRLLGTEEVIVIMHTDCGMRTFDDETFKRSIEAEVGVKPDWSEETFGDVHDDVRRAVAQIKASPFLPKRDSVRGFVYDVATGKLTEVEG